MFLFTLKFNNCNKIFSCMNAASLSKPGNLTMTQHCFLFQKSFISFFCFREWEMEEEWEGKKHQCERETSIGCLQPMPQGTTPATQACALPRNWTSDFSDHRTMPNRLSHTGWCQHCFLKFIPYSLFTHVPTLTFIAQFFLLISEFRIQLQIMHVTYLSCPFINNIFK